MRSLTYEMDLSSGRDRVWEAWTTAEGLSSWMCAHARVDPVVGGLIELWGVGAPSTGPSTSSGHGSGARGSEPSLVLRVLSINHPRLLELECTGYGRMAEGRRQVKESRIKVELFPTLDGTRVEIAHGGWGRTDDAMWLRDRFEGLWGGALEGLRAAIRD